MTSERNPRADCALFGWSWDGTIDATDQVGGGTLPAIGIQSRLASKATAVLLGQTRTFPGRSRISSISRPSGISSYFRSRFERGARIRVRGTGMEESPSGAIRLIDRLHTGDNQAQAELFDQYRDRLRCILELRMDPRLRARLDVSDVLPEAYLDLAGDLEANRAAQAAAPALDAAARPPAADHAAWEAPGRPPAGCRAGDLATL
jgi:hypothetical protein